ncbi:MAG: glycosyltransferase family 4 protein [Patescibacteria group bacterium]
MLSTIKKIAIVSAVFPPYRGGIGTVAYNQARVLAEMGHEVTVFTPDYTRTTPNPSSERRGFKVELIKPVLKHGNAAWVPGLKERLKDFDVVILQYPFFGGMKAVYQAKKKYNFKLITNYNMDVVGGGLKGLVFKYATKYFLPRIVKISDFVLASSEDYAQHSALGKYWQANNPKFQIIPNGVDINKFVFSDAPRERIVLFVGGLDRAHYFKGVEYLIRAVALLLRPHSSGGSNPDNASGVVLNKSNIQRDDKIAAVAGTLPRNDSFKLVIAGQGELMETYKKLAQDLGVAEKAEFVGGVSDEELVKLYQKAGVTVLPSIDQSEAFGIVLVESLACGMPVISSDLPGVRAVYENNISGFTVPPRDEKALAEKISDILNNPEKARAMGLAGRKLAEERYDWERIGSKLSEIILN